MASLAALELTSLQGERVRLGDIIDRPAIVVAVRYFG